MKKKNDHAVSLGRKGGLVKSSRKVISSRKNGALGGRPITKAKINGVHFFDAVDDVRAQKKFNALKQISDTSRSSREKALVNSTVKALAKELKIQEPLWAHAHQPLKEPYFVSQIENLKASALLESSAYFKMNNIFVLENFLDRV